jgi:hypothetical protein
MPVTLQDLLQLGLVVLPAGLIGAEREYHDKAAGFRTLILIAAGACLFTVISLRLGGIEDPVRIAAGIVAGIGFLGAGDILRDGCSSRAIGPDRHDELLGLFSECRLRVRRIKRSRYPRGQVYTFDVHGSPRRHEEAVGRLLQLPDLIELRH